MALEKRILQMYASNMAGIVERNVKSEDFFDYANRDLVSEGFEGEVRVSTRLLRVDMSGFLFAYYPSSSYKGPSPLMLAVEFFGNNSSITLECGEEIKGYEQLVKDIEENLVQRKNFNFEGMSATMSHLLKDLA